MRIAVTMAIVLFFGFLVTSKVMVHAHAGQSGTGACAKASEQVHRDSLMKGFSEAGAKSQAENFLSGCLITG